MTSALPGLRLLLALALAAGCAAAPPRDEQPLGPEDDPDEIRALPGYHVEMVDEPIFGGRVFVLEAGPPNAPAVVLVHGLGESGARDFYPILPSLASRYHVLTFDLPGFGRSSHGRALYSPQNYGELIHHLAQSRLHGPYAMIGHSMGGAIALAYAGRFAAEISRLVLIDAAGILHRKAYVNFAVSAGLDRYLGLLAEPTKEIANAAMEVTSGTPPMAQGGPNPSIVLENDLLRAALLKTPTRIAALAVILENFAPILAEVKAPTLVLWGGRDNIASPRTGRVLEARLPRARLKVLEHAGHDPMASEPSAVSALVLEALAAADPPPAPPAPPPRFDRVGRCDNRQGMELSGDYSTIDIVRCSGVVLRNVRALAVRIRDSFVTIENARVRTEGVALELRGSRVEITASDFSGVVAMDVDGSDVDLAGVVLEGTRAAVHIAGPSKLLFSVSRVDSPINHRYLHDLFELTIGAEI